MNRLRSNQQAVAYSMNSIIVDDIDLKQQRSTARNAVLITLLALIIIFAVPCFTYAADDDILTIFSSKAFQGSMEVVQSFNWLGKIMNFIISAFCLIGLFLVMYSRMITLLYLSSRNVWDSVNEVKTHMNGGFFGFPGLGTYTFKESGGGIDSFVSFFYGLLPNVKKYSDYSDNTRSNLNLEDTDNALDYILKVGPSTILIMFFLAIGFSGTLSQGYGKIVSAMVTVADNFIAINFDGYIDSFFKLGDAPTFTLGADGSAKGDLQQKIAKKICSYVTAECNITDKTARQNLASTCENVVASHFTEAQVSSITGVDISSERDWDRVKLKNVVKSPTSTGSPTTEIIPIQEIYPGYEGENYFHVVLEAGNVSENYFSTAE